MIKWLCYKITRLGSRYSERDRDSIPIAVDSSPDICMDKALRFNLLPARGGSVLEIRTHDSRNHEWDTVTHVIPDGANIAKEVGDIVAMELLRR
jgi:hypothetical protein